MNLKVVALFVGCAAASVSLASYEMLLFVSNGRVHRYDPEAQVSLGSFGQGQLGPWSLHGLAVSKVASRQVDVLNGDGVIRKFNYDTGAYLGSTNLGVGYFSNLPLRLRNLSNGNYLVNGYEAGGMTSKIFSNTGTLLSTMSPYGSSYSPLDSAIGTDGNIYTLNRILAGSDYFFYTFVFNSSGGYIGFNYLGSFASANQFTTIGTAKNKILVSGTAGYYTRYGGLGVGQTYTPVDWSVWSGGGTVGTFAEAHNRTFLHEFSGSGTYTNRLCTYDATSNTMTPSYFDMPYTDYIGQMGIVLAPEPGSFLALALGGAWMLRRNKKA